MQKSVYYDRKPPDVEPLCQRKACLPLRIIGYCLLIKEVLIPVHDHWAITLNTLRSIVAMANDTSFEVIVAHDALTDAIIRWLPTCPGCGSAAPITTRAFSTPAMVRQHWRGGSAYCSSKTTPPFTSTIAQQTFCQKGGGPRQWAAAFVHWNCHEHRHSAIKFETSQQRHSGQAVAICECRTLHYQQVRQLHPSPGHDLFVAGGNLTFSGPMNCQKPGQASRSYAYCTWP